MISGLEPLLLKAFGPAVGKIIGTAGAKAGALGFASWQERLRVNKTRQNLLPAKKLLTSLKEIPELDATTASLLANYVESSDFSEICVRLAIEIAPYSAKRKSQIAEASKVRDELQQSLRLHLGQSVDEDTLIAITSTLFKVAAEAVLDHSAAYVAVTTSSKTELRAISVAASAAAAEASVRNTDLLKKVKSLDVIHTFETQLRDQIRAAHSSMKLPHAGTTRKVPYRQLFVEPMLNVLEDGVQSDIMSNPLKVQDALAASPRTVVLGNPGGGKSTLALKFTWDLARLAPKPGRPSVPLLVVLREYSESIKSDKQTLVSYLESVCRSPYNIEPPPGAIEYLLLNGKAFVILDGLDELIDISVRQQLVSSVEAFATLYPTVPILVTTREVGYEQAPLDEKVFSSFSLAPLSRPQVEEYARKWFSLDDSVDKTHREDLARAFITDSEFVSDLRTNPLMLSLMCGIYASEHYIPANRPEVYRKCAELLFERWDKQRGIITPLPFDAHVRFALNALALWMFSNPKYDTGLSRSALTRFMTKYLLDRRFSDEADAENAAEQFISFCTGRAWVLTDVGSDRQQELYGFTHRTFLEFFAANQLVRLNSSASALFDALISKIELEEWDMVGQLALQILGNNVEDGSDDFLARLLDVYDATMDRASKRNMLAFANRSLGFIVPRPTIVDRLVNATIEQDRSSKSSPSSTSPVWQGLMNCGTENRPAVSRALREVFESHARPNEAALKSIAFLGELDARNAMSPLTENLNYWHGLERSLFNDLQEAFELGSQRYSWVHTLRATAGTSSISDVISTHGYQALVDFKIAGRSGRGPLIYRWLIGYLDGWRDGYLEDCVRALPDPLLSLRIPWVDMRTASFTTLLTAAQNGSMFSASREAHWSGDTITGSILAWLPIAEGLLLKAGKSILSKERPYAGLDTPLYHTVLARANVAGSRKFMFDFMGESGAPLEAMDLLLKWIDGEISLCRSVPRPRSRAVDSHVDSPQS